MNQDMNKRIGLIIRSKRKEAGITQADLGELIGISRTSIVNIESGNQSLTIENLYLIAEKLKCPVHGLIPNVKPRFRLTLKK